MFDTATRPLTGIDTAVDHLLAITASLAGAGGGLALEAASPLELVTCLETLQQAVNLVTTVEQQVLAHALDANRFEQFGAASTAGLLVDRLHLNRADAHARVRRAKRAAPRTTLTGEPLPPRLEQLAEAQVAGAVSGDHADAVATWMTRIERKASLDQFAAAETRLVATASEASPDAVARVGRELLADIDPDGPEPVDIEKRRGFTLRQRADGSGSLDGSRLTPELLAKLQAVLSPLAAPRPENPDTGERDLRGVRVRNHDAFDELMNRVLQSDTLPNHGGIPLTLVVMMDIDDLIARTGTARTPFGTTIPVKRLLEQAAELQVVPVVLSKVDGIVAYGVERRLATPGQTYALIARDKGCTFPGCSRPAQWCQRHHIKEVVADNGETNLDNLVLVCAHHHRHFGRWGWSVHLERGHAWWTPPATVDPDRRPLRNTMHD